MVTRHPVHVLNNEGRLSPSSFIPFCEFGGNMLKMGKKIDHFDVPVCNSFQAKIINDQLCYEVDLKKFSNKVLIKKLIFKAIGKGANLLLVQPDLFAEIRGKGEIFLYFFACS